MRIASDGYRRCIRCNTLGRAGTPTAALFWEMVDKSGDCWLWTGRIPSNGYGIYTMTDREKPRTVMAHRFAYELLVGPIPEGLDIDHLCKVRRCVRPAHLEPVTHLENMRRSRLFCAKGHKLSETRRVWKSGRSCCGVCYAEFLKKQQEERHARGLKKPGRKVQDLT
jgi:hypothetical protein